MIKTKSANCHGEFSVQVVGQRVPRTRRNTIFTIIVLGEGSNVFVAAPLPSYLIFLTGNTQEKVRVNEAVLNSILRRTSSFSSFHMKDVRIPIKRVKETLQEVANVQNIRTNIMVIRRFCYCQTEERQSEAINSWLDERLDWNTTLRAINTAATLQLQNGQI